MATTPKKKSVPAKKTTVHKAALAKKPKAVAVRSFRRSEEKIPFFTFEFTQQSLYWLILSVLVLALGAWVMYLNVKIQDLYDQVEINSALNQSDTAPAATKTHPTADATQ
jgi:hypothetical protein